MYNLRGGFLVRPLIIALALGSAGALLSWLEETFPVVSAWVPTTVFPSHADPQVAQVILAGIAASMMTVVSIVFAILLRYRAVLHKRQSCYTAPKLTRLAALDFPRQSISKHYIDREKHMAFWSRCITALALTLSSSLGLAQTAPMTPDIPRSFTPPQKGYDYVKREVMIPMRDGVKLYTVIVIPKGASNAPILLTRTPYNASERGRGPAASHMLAILPQGDEVFVKAGYIRVFQDVRGKYESEGDYVMTRPPRGR